MRRLPQSRGVVFGLAAAVLLGACGGATTGDDAGSAEGQAVAEPATEDQRNTEPETEADLPPASVAEMTAEDGFTPLHDFELPEPGRATLVVDGETIHLEVFCHQFSQLEQKWDRANYGGGGLHLFFLGVVATGETSDGRGINLYASREIATIEMRRSVPGMFYDHPGQDKASLAIATTISGETFPGETSIYSPSSGDRTGARLPILHVDASGAFTADEEMTASSGSPEGSLEGRFQLAGQCPEG